MSPREIIEEEAALWVARRDGESWTARDSANLEQWLARSTGHRVAYLRLNSGWERLDGLANRPAGAPPPPLKRSWRQRSAWLIGLAAAAVIIIMVTIPLLRPSGPEAQTYATQIGARSAVSLADGSHVEINTNSQIRTAVDSRQRTVWLDRGEAFFSIAPDKAHPFIVHSGATRITVVGTRFSVRADGPGVTVAVLEGHVRIDPNEGGGASTLLTPGDTAVVQDMTMLVRKSSVSHVARVMAWRNDQLRFDDVPLRKAVEEFNRYNRRQLRIVDDDIAELRVGGNFRSTDVDAFARLLESVFGLQVVSLDNSIEISRKGAVRNKDIGGM